MGVGGKINNSVGVECPPSKMHIKGITVMITWNYIQNGTFLPDKHQESITYSI